MLNEQDILELLNKISQNLDAGEICIGKNDWDTVGELFKEIDDIQIKIKANEPSLDTLTQQNPDFKTQVDANIALLQGKNNHVINVIEKWKQKHTEKISGSKDLLDNISKYYKPNQTSYYIDRKE
jgi:hypothetical protein